MSDDDDEDALEIIPSLRLIVEELSRCHSRAKVLLATERRIRRQERREMAEALRKLRGKLAKVMECLDEVEEIPSEEKKIEEEKKNPNKQKRGRDEEEEGANAVAMVEDEVGGRKRASRSDAVGRVVKRPRAKKLVDGGPCLVRDVGDRGDEMLVFFALQNVREDKTFRCPVLSNAEQHETVERSQLEPVEFGSLNAEARGRYLSLLENDIVSRFGVNSAVVLKGEDILYKRWLCILFGPTRKTRREKRKILIFVVFFFQLYGLICSLASV